MFNDPTMLPGPPECSIEAERKDFYGLKSREEPNGMVVEERVQLPIRLNPGPQVRTRPLLISESHISHTHTAFTCAHCPERKTELTVVMDEARVESVSLDVLHALDVESYRASSLRRMCNLMAQARRKQPSEGKFVRTRRNASRACKFVPRRPLFGSLRGVVPAAIGSTPGLDTNISCFDGRQMDGSFFFWENTGQELYLHRDNALDHCYVLGYNWITSGTSKPRRGY
ncbi:hypothetical protein DFH07DRAFT_779447 [Mycena maculata]|uniref:Uncharacterized protein n=1 Tax=Mycena maculata TaxID=230809 RepID=A0AAD7I9R8_9AGAR|nr:hypothetical protein DFH07DRAFT_779447 [Mycena maculata]